MNFEFEDIFRNRYTVRVEKPLKITVAELSVLMNEKIVDSGRFCDTTFNELADDKSGRFCDSTFDKLILQYKDEKRRFEPINDEDKQKLAHELYPFGRYGTSFVPTVMRFEPITEKSTKSAKKEKIDGKIKKRSSKSRRRKHRSKSRKRKHRSKSRKSRSKKSKKHSLKD